MRRSLGVICVAVMTAGCAASPTPEQTPEQTSEQAPAAATEPAFDQARARELVAEARAARGRGDDEAAETHLLAAVAAWPASAPAWAELAALYEDRGDEADLRFARFFHARTMWIDPAQPILGIAILENAAEGRVPAARAEPRIRRQAERTLAFLQERRRALARAEPGSDTLAWTTVPAALAIGAGFVIFAPSLVSD